jgi:translation initiation factor IF-1
LSRRRVRAKVIEELPSLVYRVELERKQTALAHAAGNAQRNFVRLLPGDRVEVELAPHDDTRGRIVRKLDDSK